MDFTVLVTVISGVLTYVLGQLVVKIVIEPVQETRRTIGQISHSLIERGNVIANPGVPTEEAMRETAQQLRNLSSQLQSHLYLVPAYATTARVFRLPSKDELLSASKNLIALSTSVYRATDRVHEENATHVEKIRDALSIYMPEDERISRLTN